MSRPGPKTGRERQAAGGPVCFELAAGTAWQVHGRDPLIAPVGAFRPGRHRLLVLAGRGGQLADHPGSRILTMLVSGRLSGPLIAHRYDTGL